MPTHSEVIEGLIKERDAARHIARCLADFLREWDGLAEVRGEMAGYAIGTPEFELYIAAVVAHDLMRETDWLSPKELTDPTGR